MTAKEAVIFLKAPTDLTVDENVWWAKLAAAGVPSAMARSITTSILWRIVPGGHERKFDELISFFARFHAATDPKQFDNLTQFLDWKLSEDEPFYLKGRTPASVLKLAAEWRRLYRGNSYGTLIAWEGLGCRPWTRYLKTTICDIVELRTNRQLMDEGRKQRNCVFTYVSNCVSADSAIFSLRAHSGYVAMCDKNSQEPAMEKVNEIYRLTIEVAPQRREIVQIKARLNNSADDEQLKIVKDWAALYCLKFSNECEL